MCIRASIFGGFDNGFLCSGGPLYGLHDIARFENGEREGGYEEGYQTVYAVDQNGDRYDLAGRITPMANAMPFPVTGDWYAEVRHGVEGGGSYTSSYFLSFSKNGFTSIENFMEDMEDLSIDYGGYCTYLGMTEQGMIYLFNPVSYTHLLRWRRARRPHHRPAPERDSRSSTCRQCSFSRSGSRQPRHTAGEMCIRDRCVSL